MDNRLHTLWQSLKHLLKPSPTTEDIARGEESEAKVFKIITDMMVWDELPPRMQGARPYRTDKWSRLDRDGIDIVIPTIRGDIYIQVKSSGLGFMNFVSDIRNRDKVCIVGQDDDLIILKQLRNKLRIAYERLNDQS